MFEVELICVSEIFFSIFIIIYLIHKHLYFKRISFFIWSYFLRSNYLFLLFLFVNYFKMSKCNFFYYIDVVYLTHKSDWLLEKKNFWMKFRVEN